MEAGIGGGGLLWRQYSPRLKRACACADGNFQFDSERGRRRLLANCFVCNKVYEHHFRLKDVISQYYEVWFNILWST